MPLASSIQLSGTAFCFANSGIATWNLNGSSKDGSCVTATNSFTLSIVRRKPAPSCALASRESGLSNMICKFALASRMTGGCGGNLRWYARTSSSRIVIGLMYSLCCRPIVGASKMPFSFARSITSVALICGVFTSIWNSVTRALSLMMARSSAIASLPICVSPTGMFLTISRPWSSIPPGFIAPGRFLKPTIPSSLTSLTGSTARWPARNMTDFCAFKVLSEGRTSIAHPRP